MSQHRCAIAPRTQVCNDCIRRNHRQHESQTARTLREGTIKSNRKMHDKLTCRPSHPTHSSDRNWPKDTETIWWIAFAFDVASLCDRLVRRGPADNVNGDRAVHQFGTAWHYSSPWLNASATDSLRSADSGAVDGTMHWGWWTTATTSTLANAIWKCFWHVCCRTKCGGCGGCGWAATVEICGEDNTLLCALARKHSVIQDNNNAGHKSLVSAHLDTATKRRRRRRRCRNAMSTRATMHRRLDDSPEDSTHASRIRIACPPTSQAKANPMPRQQTQSAINVWSGWQTTPKLDSTRCKLLRICVRVFRPRVSQPRRRRRLRLTLCRIIV